jgi:K+-sensing histidine kinase KdpD
MKSKVGKSKIKKSISDEQSTGLLEGYGLIRRLTTLSEIVLQIDAAVSKEEIFEILRNETPWLADYEVLYLALLNPMHTYYYIVTLSPITDASGLNHNYFNIEEGIPGWVIRNQSPLIRDSTSAQGRSNALEGKFEELGIKTFLAVPIKSGQDKVGCLIFGSMNPDNYKEEDLAIAQLFGLQVAVVIKNVSFFEEAKKRITQIEIMNEISTKLNSTLEIEELLNATVEAIQQNFSYYDVSILLFTENKSELIVKAHAGGYENVSVIGMKQKVGEGLIGWVAQHGEYALANDVAQDPRYAPFEYHATKSELVLPIKISGEVVGVLNIEDSKTYAFDEMDVVVLQTLGDQISRALNNAQLYKEIIEANLKLTDLDHLKSEFLGIVSHDFRSPLSTIILAAKTLLRNEEVQKMNRFKEYLTMIVGQANRLNQLAEDTLSITEIESGQVTIESKVVNVERVIRDAISSVRFSNRHSVNYTVDQSVSFIKADQARLRQVLQNLLSNSIKYSPNGCNISVAVYDYSNDEVLFSVTDEGIGIKQEYHDKLFQKFSRVDSTEVKKIKGSGLGLWICKEIVEAHDGKIWVESEFGKGSTFKFTIRKADD